MIQPADAETGQERAGGRGGGKCAVRDAGRVPARATGLRRAVPPMPPQRLPRLREECRRANRKPTPTPPPGVSRSGLRPMPGPTKDAGEGTAKGSPASRRPASTGAPPCQSARLRRRARPLRRPRAVPRPSPRSAETSPGGTREGRESRPTIGARSGRLRGARRLANGRRRERGRMSLALSSRRRPFPNG